MISGINHYLFVVIPFRLGLFVCYFKLKNKYLFFKKSFVENEKSHALTLIMSKGFELFIKNEGTLQIVSQVFCGFLFFLQVLLLGFLFLAYGNQKLQRSHMFKRLLKVLLVVLFVATPAVVNQLESFLRCNFFSVYSSSISEMNNTYFPSQSCANVGLLIFGGISVIMTLIQVIVLLLSANAFVPLIQNSIFGLYNQIGCFFILFFNMVCVSCFFFRFFFSCFDHGSHRLILSFLSSCQHQLLGLWDIWCHFWCLVRVFCCFSWNNHFIHGFARFLLVFFLFLSKFTWFIFFQDSSRINLWVFYFQSLLQHYNGHSSRFWPIVFISFESSVWRCESFCF